MKPKGVHALLDKNIRSKDGQGTNICTDMRCSGVGNSCHV